MGLDPIIDFGSGATSYTTPAGTIYRGWRFIKSLKTLVKTHPCDGGYVVISLPVPVSGRGQTVESAVEDYLKRLISYYKTLQSNVERDDNSAVTDLQLLQRVMEKVS